MRLSIGVGKGGERFDEIGLKPRLPSQSFTGHPMLSLTNEIKFRINNIP